MCPTLQSGDKITVEPIAAADVKVGEVVLYRVADRLFAHRVVKTECELEASNSRSNAVAGRRTAGTGSTESNTLTALPLSSSGERYLDHTIQLRPRRIIVRGDSPGADEEIVESQQVLGRVVVVERQGHGLRLYGWRSKWAYVRNRCLAPIIDRGKHLARDIRRQVKIWKVHRKLAGTP